MRACIWYRTELTQPLKSGHYLCYRGWGIAGKADGDSDWGYVYYDKKINMWREYQSTSSSYAIVYYWTTARPDDWVDQDPPSVTLRKLKEEHNVALEDAWKKVVEAVDQYNMIKELVK